MSEYTKEVRRLGVQIALDASMRGASAEAKRILRETMSVREDGLFMVPFSKRVRTPTLDRLTAEYARERGWDMHPPLLNEKDLEQVPGLEETVRQLTQRVGELTEELERLRWERPELWDRDAQRKLRRESYGNDLSQQDPPPPDGPENLPPKQHKFRDLGQR